MVHSPQVMQRFELPQYIQRDSASAVGSAGSRLAGALVELHLSMENSADNSTENASLRAGFRAYGCPATIASADWLAEQLNGLPVDAATELDRHAIIRALELPAARQHCAALAVEALGAALQNLHR